MKPLTFQQKAIDELISSFKTLWTQPESKLPVVFKSPTGSGKTFMTSAFINEMTEQPDWDADVAWIWITFSDDLAMQSRDKFAQYFSQNLKNQLITVADFNQGKLNKNDVLFLNWQKLVSTKAEDRLLRRPENPENAKESGCYFEDGKYYDKFISIQSIENLDTRAELPLNYTTKDGINFNGSIDRIDQNPDGTYSIYDYSLQLLLSYK